MICFTDNPHSAELLTDYCAGTLDAKRAGEIEAHLQRCAKCKDLAQAQRMVWEALDSWRPVEVSPSFDAKLYARIDAEADRPWWKQGLWRPLLPLAAAGVALALALMVWMPRRTAPADSSVRGEKIDIQQVEQALDDMDLLSPVGAM